MTATSADKRLVLDVESLPFAVIAFDADGRATGANRLWTDLTGQRGEKALGDRWLTAVVDADRLDVQQRVRRALAGGPSGVADWRLVTPSGARWVRARIETVRTPDGTVVGGFLFMADREEEHAREVELQYHATHDALTGVLNRAQFIEQTRHALARLVRHPCTLALIFIDLDEFKAVNDVYGHVFGDRVLAAQAERFHRAVRPDDAVARYGGDEFVVLCEDLASGDEARAVAERIVSDLSSPFEVDRVAIALRASVGVVTTDDPSADVTTLLEQADHAMYRAKQRGHDRVELVQLAGRRVQSAREGAADVIDLDAERLRDWRLVLGRIHHQLLDAEAALGRLWAEEFPHDDRQAAHRLADAARHVNRAVRSLSDDVIGME